MRGSDDNSYPGLPRRLTRLRNAQGLSRQELADRAGVTFNTINDIEKGRRTHPMEKTLQSLALSLDVSYEYLATGESVGDGPAPKGRPRARRLLGAPRPVLVAAVSILAVAGVMQWRWEAARHTADLECVVLQPGGAYGKPVFDDVDADGMVELIRGGGGDAAWSLAELTPTPAGRFSLKPALDLPCEGASVSDAYPFDLDGDGRKEVINLCRSDGGSRIEVRSGDEGALRSGVMISASASAGEADEPKDIVAVVRDERRSTDVAILSAVGHGELPGSLHCVDIRTGEEIWRYVSDQRIGDIDVVPSTSGRRFGVFLWSHKPDSSPSNGVTPYITALDADGRVSWARPAGHRGAALTGSVLRSAAGDAELVLVVANCPGEGHDSPSHLLLLNTVTGAPVDSLPYTDHIVNRPLARPDVDGSGWSVYCGTEHGTILKYEISDGHIRLAAKRQIATHWVWTQDFMAGDEERGAIVVATADNVCYIVDRDLDVLYHRLGKNGAPITPLTSFADTAGVSYVAFVCHGADLCIDRMVLESGWGQRRWYLAAYSIALGIILVAQTPVRYRFRSILAALPSKRLH